ncbi:hypothetical protein O6H91_02G125400 [Diphasiastrum complanatum]|uniref:Uncharacterized protein n=1 Tax=Diphasiastrum complanatum TaxID=34168 RepID=A0ACC2EKE2_DIPCM|nr:hypothetical protein O6H91_02G125400 [Diphasiastrum complanatum]
MASLNDLKIIMAVKVFVFVARARAFAAQVCFCALLVVNRKINKAVKIRAKDFAAEPYFVLFFFKSKAVKVRAQFSSHWNDGWPWPIGNGHGFSFLRISVLQFILFFCTSDYHAHGSSQHCHCLRWHHMLSMPNLVILGKTILLSGVILKRSLYICLKAMRHQLDVGDSLLETWHWSTVAFCTSFLLSVFRFFGIHALDVFLSYKTRALFD